jgi:hypothetical protein
MSAVVETSFRLESHHAYMDDVVTSAKLERRGRHRYNHTAADTEKGEAARLAWCKITKTNQRACRTHCRAIATMDNSLCKKQHNTSGRVRAYIFALAVSKKRSAELVQDVTVSTSK